MRLNHPNDELGGMLLMCFPQEILHELDAWSPLMPPPSWGSAHGVYHWHPPVLAHAKLTSESQPVLSSDPTEDYYDPDLYNSWPGVSRRSASEEPGGIWRKKMIKPSQQNLKLINKAEEVACTTPPRKGMAISKSRKKKISLGITPHVERGQSRQNYFEMIRTIAETQFTGHTPPPPNPHGHGHGHSAPSPSHENSSENISAMDPNDHSATVSDSEEERDCEQHSIRPFAPQNHPPPDSPAIATAAPRHEPLSSSLPLSSTSRDKELLTQSSPSSLSPSPAGIMFPPPLHHHHPAAPSEDENFQEFHWQQIERNMIKKFLADRNVEVIVLIEGQDSATGGVVQARHSYKLEDLVWNTSFIPCVLQDELDGTPVIDFSLFHETELSYHDDEEDEDGRERVGAGFTQQRRRQEKEEIEKGVRDVIDQKMAAMPLSTMTSGNPASEKKIRRSYQSLENSFSRNSDGL
jgi:hypothetical protein